MWISEKNKYPWCLTRKQLPWIRSIDIQELKKYRVNTIDQNQFEIRVHKLVRTANSKTMIFAAVKILLPILAAARAEADSLFLQCIVFANRKRTCASRTSMLARRENDMRAVSVDLANLFFFLRWYMYKMNHEFERREVSEPIISRERWGLVGAQHMHSIATGVTVSLCAETIRWTLGIPSCWAITYSLSSSTVFIIFYLQCSSAFSLHFILLCIG